MGHREVKRVPLDFDWPRNEVWEGYLTPAELRPPSCPDCGGSGYSPLAEWLLATYYAFGAPTLAWRDKLTQADVDALVAAGRLSESRRREPTADNPREWEWVQVRRTADEVNAAQRTGRMLGGLSLDAISRGILVERRCEALGGSNSCPRCGGEGDIGTPAERDAYENWEATEPPTGVGWQLWETTSEGSPVTPVFPTADDLASYCAEHASPFADSTWTKAQWLASFTASSTETDSLMVLDGTGFHTAGPGSDAESPPDVSGAGREQLGLPNGSSGVHA